MEESHCCWTVFITGDELFQIFFSLGTFEFDDLIHNTFEAVIGYQIIENIGFRTEIKRKQLRFFLIMFFVSIISPIAIQSVQHQHMVKLAIRYDR